MDKSRVPYPDPADLHRFYESAFERTVDYALKFAEHYDDEKISDLLHMLEGAVYPDDPQAMEGATFKSLAYVAHVWGLSREERQRWYGIAQELPLSQAHVGYITQNIHARNEIFSDLDEMVKEQS